MFKRDCIDWWIKITFFVLLSFRGNSTFNYQKKSTKKNLTQYYRRNSEPCLYIKSVKKGM